MAKKNLLRRIIKLIFLTIGVIFVAVALELFLIPNKIIDGGIVGISIMASYLTKMSLSLFIFVLNTPFLIFAFRKLGRNFVFTSFYCIAALAIVIIFIHKMPNVTNDMLLACVFGGMVLGIGLGLILRNNGSLDGTEIIAVKLSRITGFSVGEIIMIFNIFILGSAGFIFGWDRAMYSLLTYFIVFKTIDIVMNGLDESKSVIIISDKYEEIAAGIVADFEYGVTYIEGKGAYSGDVKKIIFCVVTRLELTSLKNYVLDVDPSAFITVENVHEVQGGLIKKPKLKV